MAAGTIHAAKRLRTVADHERLAEELDVPTWAVLELAERVANERDGEREDVQAGEVRARVTPEWCAQVWRADRARVAVHGLEPDAAEALVRSIEERRWAPPGERRAPMLTLVTGGR